MELRRLLPLCWKMLSLRWGVSWPTSTTCTCSRGALHLTAYFGPMGTRLLISGGPLIKYKSITLRLHNKVWLTITNNTWSEDVWTIVTEIQESELCDQKDSQRASHPPLWFQEIIIHVFLCYAWSALRTVRWDWRMQQNFEASVKSFWSEVFENSMTQWSLMKKPGRCENVTLAPQRCYQCPFQCIYVSVERELKRSLNS